MATSANVARSTWRSATAVTPVAVGSRPLGPTPRMDSLTSWLSKTSEYGRCLSSPPTVLADSDYLDKEGVYFARAKEIRVESSPGSLEFTVDGEVIGDGPAVFAVIPQALKVVVGPGYVPEA